ncbi:hypothetical protein ACRAWF_27895 [Streptomyces sp. L7]
MLRAALAQLALFHPPEELADRGLRRRRGARGVEWVKWLPH